MVRRSRQSRRSRSAQGAITASCPGTPPGTAAFATMERDLRSAAGPAAARPADRRARLSGFRELIEAPWWVGFFWGAGLLAVGSAIVSLFFSLGRRPPAVRATATPEVNDPRFLDAAAGLVNGVPSHGG